MTQHPLESSRRKLARAKKHIGDLAREVDRFSEADPATIFVEPDAQNPNHEVHKLRLNKPFPTSIADITADAVHNLRASLDNAGYGLAVASGRVNPKHTAFPFSGSAVEFENNMKGRCKDIPKEIHAVFRRYQPYRGGNDFLWALNEACIADKHKTLIRLGIGSVLGSFGMVSGGLVSIPMHTWDSANQEITLGTFVANSNVKYNMDLSLFVAFDEVEIISGQPVLDTLDHFADVVEHILASLEAEARRLGIVN